MELVPGQRTDAALPRANRVDRRRQGKQPLRLRSGSALLDQRYSTHGYHHSLDCRLGRAESNHSEHDAPALAEKWHKRGAYVAGICTSVAFLAESGLLDGRQATTHWGISQELQDRYPKVLWRPEQFITEDNRVLCSGGVYASIDLGLYLVERFCGHEVALQCAKSLLVSMPRARQSGYSVLPLSRPHSDSKIREAEEYFQRQYNRNVSIESIAERIGMSPRNFIRRFKTATGHLPGAYLQTLRMAAAKELLERSDLPVQHICSKIGYEDVAFFRSLFKRHTAMTPVEYRNRFARMDFDRGEIASGTPVN